MKSEGGPIESATVLDTLLDPSHEVPLTHTLKQRVFVFFDEINTADCLGLFKEIVCDRMMDGQPLPKSLISIAACNPYRQKVLVRSCQVTSNQIKSPEIPIRSYQGP